MAGSSEEHQGAGLKLKQSLLENRHNEGDAGAPKFGEAVRLQDLRLDHPGSGRDHGDEDLQVYPDRMVEDLSSVYPDLKDEGDLLRVCPVSAAQA
ncbi:MAG: hypothetical protein H0U72_02115 [Nitrosospira sp.]|nr:hypothetical protein [Nitrosospira sp.]